ncbi:DUF397 domain-containing protein [Streptomyces sp. CA-111067]|uniref:DUF397 domain-containing protein n=1 Tax=Streptomyces sp. CA-111067 TaxID=3240046 RepID=UPI003D9775D8
MTLTWTKSSYSGSNGGDCVEVAAGSPGTVPVRDSKNPHGPQLTFTAPAWTAFLTALRTGDLPAPR